MDENELDNEDSLAPAEAEEQIPVQVETTNLVQDEQLLGAWGEAMDLARQDRVEASGILNDLLEMVINQGDSSSASKEAIVQILKIKNDAVNTMVKVADLMTRVKLRERDTMPDYLRGKTAEPEQDKKSWIKQLNKAVKKAKGTK